MVPVVPQGIDRLLERHEADPDLQKRESNLKIASQSPTSLIQLVLPPSVAFRPCMHDLECITPLHALYIRSTAITNYIVDMVYTRTKLS